MLSAGYHAERTTDKAVLNEKRLVLLAGRKGWLYLWSDAMPADLNFRVLATFFSAKRISIEDGAPLSIMTRRYPASSRIRRPSPIAFMPSVVPSHWITVTIYLHELRARLDRQVLINGIIG
jgi:hypothetical protein